MVFKLGGRLLNMETRTLSPGAPETRRGFFLSASASAGAAISTRKVIPGVAHVSGQTAA
jgi:hypothetical protein